METITNHEWSTVMDRAKAAAETLSDEAENLGDLRDSVWHCEVASLFAEGINSHPEAADEVSVGSRPLVLALANYYIKAAESRNQRAEACR